MESSEEPAAPVDDSAPWPQQLMDSIWVLALVAIVFFLLSYLVWGFIDLLTLPTR